MTGAFEHADVIGGRDHGFDVGEDNRRSGFLGSEDELLVSVTAPELALKSSTGFGLLDGSSAFRGLRWLA